MPIDLEELERLLDALRQTGDWAKCDHCERLVEDPWRWGESLMCDACYGWATTSGASEDDPFRRQEAEHFHKDCENRRKRREQRIADQAVRAFASELCGLDYNVVQERIFAKVMEAMDEDDAARVHATRTEAEGEQGGAE
jgi:hypothetical protein